MFKSKRSGLVRRLWRSRLVTESDGQDGSRRGEGGQNGPCCRHSGKLHRHDQRSVTHTDPAPGLTGEAGDPTGSAERGEEDQPDDDQGAMCVPEHRRSRPGQESDSRTVTCCLFGEWDFSPRRPYWTPRKDGGGACQCAPRHAGLEDELASTVHAFLKRLKERSLDTLAKAVETKGGITSECVMVPRTELRLCAHHISPQYLLCKLYRWSDLPLSARLKALCDCQSFSAVDSAKVCCNPYHYSRLCGPGKKTHTRGMETLPLREKIFQLANDQIRVTTGDSSKYVILLFYPAYFHNIKHHWNEPITLLYGGLLLPPEPLEVQRQVEGIVEAKPNIIKVK